MTKEEKDKINAKVEKLLARLDKVLSEERKIKQAIHKLYSKLFSYGK